MHRLKHYDLLLSDVENQVVAELVDFLSIFEFTTTILSASKAYPTMSICLLLRMLGDRRLTQQSKHNSIDRKLTCPSRFP